MTSTPAPYPPNAGDQQPGIFRSFPTFVALLKICLASHPTLRVVALKLYYLFLWNIPFIYSSRAQPLLAKIKRIAEEHWCTIHHNGPIVNSLPTPHFTQPALDLGPPVLPVAFPGHAWEAFRDSIINDCKLLIGVAAALLTALGSTIFQFVNVIVSPVSRAVAFVSMACAFISAIYAIMFIIHFRTTPDVLRGHTTERFIQAERCPYTWFNLWTLLALPLIWITWSIITAIIFALLFLWHTSPTTGLPHSDVGCSARYISPIAVTSVLSVGVLYLILALRVLRSW